jgi:hypothetical protein
MDGPEECIRELARKSQTQWIVDCRLVDELERSR